MGAMLKFAMPNEGFKALDTAVKALKNADVSECFKTPEGTDVAEKKTAYEKLLAKVETEAKAAATAAEKAGFEKINEMFAGATEESSGFPAWAIALIVVGVVAVVGGA